MELTRPVTLETDFNNDYKSNKENNTKVADKKLNNNTEETIENVDTNDTFLEPSESAASMKDVKKTRRNITTQHGGSRTIPMIQKTKQDQRGTNNCECCGFDTGFCGEEKHY